MAVAHQYRREEIEVEKAARLFAPCCCCRCQELCLWLLFVLALFFFFFLAIMATWQPSAFSSSCWPPSPPARPFLFASIESSPPTPKIEWKQRLELLASGRPHRKIKIVFFSIFLRQIGPVRIGLQAVTIEADTMAVMILEWTWR